MDVKTTLLDGVLELQPQFWEDKRGYFMESYRENVYTAIGIPIFVQDNESQSKKGILRGMHFQRKPFGQGKLVRVVQGKILDVVVDIRKSSPTFGKWISRELDDEKKNQLWIPEGFAHGFLSLEDNTTVLYKCTQYYNKESEAGILWKDPDVNIDWQCERYDIQPLVIGKDNNHPLLRDSEDLF